MWESLAGLGMRLLGMFGGGGSAHRVDFEAVTKGWKGLADQLNARVTELEATVRVLEQRLNDCHTGHMKERERSLELEARVKHLEAEIRRSEERVP